MSDIESIDRVVGSVVSGKDWIKTLNEEKIWNFAIIGNIRIYGTIVHSKEIDEIIQMNFTKEEFEKMLIAIRITKDDKND